jgi:hypothetical protein
MIIVSEQSLLLYDEWKELEDAAREAGMSVDDYKKKVF